MLGATGTADLRPKGVARLSEFFTQCWSVAPIIRSKWLKKFSSVATGPIIASSNVIPGCPGAGVTEMKNRILGLIAVGMLAGPMAAQAVPVTWELTGVVDSTNTTMPGVAGGDAFRVLVKFDTDAALLAAQAGGGFTPGTRYEYDPTGVVFDVSIGGISFGQFTAGGTSSGSLIYLRDNSGDICNLTGSACPPEPEVADGLSMRAVDNSQASVVNFILRSSILDIVNGPGLPSTPDARLVNGEINQFYFGNNNGDVFGTIRSITAVPEPATLGLLGLGLAGLGLTRRRKTA